MIAGNRGALRPIPTGLALGVAFCLGLAYAVLVLSPGFLTGGNGFWTFPDGLIGGTPDMSMTVAGYDWFVQDSWRWPLFHIVQAGGPGGLNAALMDPVATIALPAKLWHSLTGRVVNLFPAWIAGSFALSSLALAALVRGLGQRSLLAAVLSGCLGVLASVVHQRFGHLGLAAHWTCVLALAVYANLAYADAGRSVRVLRGVHAAPGLAMVLLCAIGFMSSIYLYVMVAAVAGAFFVQAAFDRRMGWPGALLGVIGVGAAGVVPFWAFGLLGNSAITGVTLPFGQTSMNLVAPFWPQTSGIFAGTGIYALTRGSIGATIGQYEGSCYMGLGVLLLLVVALVRRWRVLPGLLRRHWVLTVCLAVLTLWAVSNQVYLGPRLLVDVPLPDVLLNTVLAWFRASARLFWPVLWMLVALAIAGSLAGMRPRPAFALVAVVLLLQWIDTSIWRNRLHDVVAAPRASSFGSPAETDAVEATIRQAGRVAVVPSPYCTAAGAGHYDAPETLAAAQTQLMAGRTNAAMRDVILSRSNTDCAAERATPLRQLAAGGAAVVLTQPAPLDRTAEAQVDMACRPVPVGLLCTSRP